MDRGRRDTMKRERKGVVSIQSREKPENCGERILEGIA